MSAQRSIVKTNSSQTVPYAQAQTRAKPHAPRLPKLRQTQASKSSGLHCAFRQWTAAFALLTAVGLTSGCASTTPAQLSLPELPAAVLVPCQQPPIMTVANELNELRELIALRAEIANCETKRAQAVEYGQTVQAVVKGKK